MRKLFLLPVLFALPLFAFARSYEPMSLPYSDTAGLDRATDVAISVLTDEGVLQGNPDGTFRPSRSLNRAEFVTIALRLLGGGMPQNPPRCFPDVAPGEWYAPAVCRAKDLGIVRGNALPTLDPSEWPFVPDRPVNYAEAVKMLVELYDIPFTPTTVWYEGYIAAAQARGIDLPDTLLGDVLSRAAMARLTVGFLAFENGELAALRAAQNGVTSSSSSSSVSSVSSSSSVSSPSSSSSSSSVATHDTYGDTTIRPQFLLLGEVSPVIGAADIFLEEEALDVRTVTVNLMTATPSVSALLVFDEDTRYLGRAFLSSGAQYVLNVQPGSFIVPRRESTTLYVRADMRSEPNGGTSGDIVEVNNFIVAGVGVWSNDQYAKASADDFPEFQTARSVPTSITNADQQESFLVAGTDRVIGAFRFEARKSDASADADITKLTFDVTKTAGVTLSNVKLGLRGFPERMDCTVSGSQIICSSIDALYGSLKSGAKILEIRADVTLPSPVPEGQTQLMLSLGSPGSITTPGAVEWTDGTTTFSWVPFDSPIARGTLYVR